MSTPLATNRLPAWYTPLNRILYDTLTAPPTLSELPKAIQMHVGRAIAAIGTCMAKADMDIYDQAHLLRQLKLHHDLYDAMRKCIILDDTSIKELQNIAIMFHSDCVNAWRRTDDEEIEEIHVSALALANDIRSLLGDIRYPQPFRGL